MACTHLQRLSRDLGPELVIRDQLRQVRPELRHRRIRLTTPAEPVNLYETRSCRNY